MECEKYRYLIFGIGATTGYKPNEECSTEDSGIGASCHHECDDQYTGKHDLKIDF